MSLWSVRTGGPYLSRKKKINKSSIHFFEKRGGQMLHYERLVKVDTMFKMV